MEGVFTGIVLKESLSNEDVLNRVKIVKTELWDIENASPEQPKTWHAIYFEGNESEAEDIATLFSKSLKSGQWYTNFLTHNKIMFVIFPGKVFEYKEDDYDTKNKAIIYGRSIGIPESQLDWE